jgi:Sperm-tail PG-rich repeat
MHDISFTLESGPGSYDIQDSFGYLSYKHYNSPRAVIAKAEKTNKLYLSLELSKQLSGLESPGVNTYDPNPDVVLSKSPSMSFGKEERDMSHIRPLLNRSPGPVYDQTSNMRPGISFTKARRNSSIQAMSPAPWDYTPTINFKIPTVLIKPERQKNPNQFLTPGPGAYNFNEKSSKPAYVSKVGRNIIKYRDLTPGPGSYDTNTAKHVAQAHFGYEKRVMDPRTCKDYIDAKSYEYYKYNQ